MTSTTAIAPLLSGGGEIGDVMTTGERHEVGEITERLNRIMEWTKWGLGLVFLLSMAVGASMIEMRSRLVNVEQAQEMESQVIDDQGSLLENLRVQAVVRDREVTRLITRLDSNSLVLTRMSDTLDELNRYVRGLPVKETNP